MSIVAGQVGRAADLYHIRKAVLTAAENLTAGMPVGISNMVNNNVARAATNHRTLTVTPQADSTRGTWAVLNTDKFLYVYAYGSALRAVVCTVNRSDMANPFTFGTVVTITSNLVLGDSASTTYDACLIDTDKFAIVYCETTATTVTRLVIGTASGNTITMGTAVNADSGANNVRGVACCQIGTGKGALCMTKLSNNRAYAFTVSGTTPTIGASAAMGGGIVDSEVTMGQVATDKFVVSDAAGGYAQCGSVSGTTVTMGAQNQYWGSGGIGGDSAWHGVYSPATNVVIISVRIGGPRYLWAGTISGTTITFGSGVSVSQQQGGLLMVSSTVFYGHSANEQTIVQYGLSGTTITVGATIAKKITCSTNTRRNFINFGTYWMLFGLDDNVADYFIQGMSNNFLGIAQATVSRGATVEVIHTGMDATQTGLTAGMQYLVLNGTLSPLGTGDTVNSLDDMNVVKALSATEVLIQ